MSNDHNALEALIEDYQDFVIRFGSKLDDNDGLRLISAARQDRERLVGALEKIEYAALKFPHPSECDHLHEVANIAKAALAVSMWKSLRITREMEMPLLGVRC